jgi:predicted lipoprotein with Yx(FWY)xxD motif
MWATMTFDRLTHAVNRRSRAVSALAGLSLAVVLAACSGSTGTTAEPTASVAASESASASEAAPSEAASMAVGDATVLVAESDFGQILTDADGNVIYYFANDSDGTSTCAGDCFANWPPVPVEGSPTAGDGVTAELGTTEATDGTTMLTVNGFPAYYFAGDAAPGDTNGQGVGDVWWVFGPDGEPIEG